MSHTPGPWQWNGSHLYGTDRGRVIGRLCYEGDDTDDANAQLIAAAPDLLAALRLVWSMFDDGRIVRNIANDGQPDWALKMLNFTRELQTIHAAISKAEPLEHAPAGVHVSGEPECDRERDVRG